MKRYEPGLEHEAELELARLETEYMRRASNAQYAQRYSYFNDATLLHVHTLERNLLALFKRYKFTALADKEILDVGCGSGGHLRRFLDYGALPAHLWGIDLLPSRIQQAQSLQPNINWHMGSAHQLPYADATFDLVMSFVVFSSILDASLSQKIADEMWRVLKPGGLLLLYDFVYSNPYNAAVQGINRRKVQHFFARQGARFDFCRITLAPPIARMIAPRAYWLAMSLEYLKFLNTHMISIISRNQEEA